jgi:hypothetical protein
MTLLWFQSNFARKSHLVALPPAAAPPKPPAVPRRYVSEDALDQVRKIAPGWDLQALLRRYMDWIEGAAARHRSGISRLGEEIHEG